MAEIALKQKSYGRATSLYREFIRTYASDRAAGELVVQAYWRIAEIKKATRARGYEDALRDVVAAYRRSGQQPGSLAAEYAAHAAFLLANDREVAAFERWKIDVGRPRTLREYAERLKRGIQDGTERAKRMIQKFGEIPSFRRPTWTIAALARQGRIIELYARNVLEAPVVIPTDIARQMRGAPIEVRDDLKIQVEDGIRDVLDQFARPLECWAIERYALAVRAARLAGLRNEYTLQAIDRLQAYGEERIAECIEQRRQKDPNLAPYQPGEFRRALRGRTALPPEGVAPPPLVTAGQ